MIALLPKNKIFILLALFMVIGGIIITSILSASSPPCPQNISGIFSVPPINFGQISAISPLGWTNNRDHILPVDHQAFIPNDSGNALSPKQLVYAPANITITSISSHMDYYPNGTPYSTGPNYFIESNVCGGIKIWMEGIHGLSPTLQDIFNKSQKTYGEGALNAGDKAVNYYINLNYKAKAGELMGWTGGISSIDSIAISAYDENLKFRTDVNFNYYPDGQKRAGIICFADLYSGNLKQIINNKFGYIDPRTLNFIPRVVEPRCGQVVQNINGTIQGDWFANKPKSGEDLQAEGKTISFIHQNMNSSIDLISIGGTIVPGPETIVFTANHLGSINRETSETKVGQIYCYQDDNSNIVGVQYQRTFGSKIVAQLLDNNHLKIESQPGSCTGNENFVNPYTYER